MTPADLTPDQRELYEERAAIMTWDGNMSREEAETAALADVLRVIERQRRKETGGGLWR